MQKKFLHHLAKRLVLVYMSDDSEPITITLAILGGGKMHRTFLALAVGAGIALALNKAIAGILNTVLSPLGLTYA